MADVHSSGGGDVRGVAIEILRPQDGTTGVAATLIGPSFAVTGARLEPHLGYPLTFATGQQAKGRWLAELPELALTLIEVSRTGTPLPSTVLDGRGFFPFITIWPGSDEFQPGVIDATSDPWTAEFKGHEGTSLQHIAGAPIVVSDLLAGVVGRLLDNDRWAVIPAQRIIDAIATVPPLPPPQQPQSEEPPLSLLEEILSAPRLISAAPFKSSVLQRFTRSALRALAHASASAGGGEIHTEHLLAGLYENPEGIARRIADARGVTRETLRRVVVAASSNELLFPGEYDPPDELTKLPSLSRHASEALENALVMATQNNEPRIRARHILYGVLSLEECDVRTALESLGFRASDIQLRDKTRISGYVSDVAQGVDRLGVKWEALALATVLGAKNVAPPIAVGLLGTWGSGKSFFMHQMERQFARIERQGRAGDPECCSNIVQIWFNAWHYIDANLWASLTSEIFDALDRELTKRDGGFASDDPEQERAKLLAESAESQSKLARVAEEKASAEKELAEIDEKRRTLDTTAASRITLRKLGAAAAGKSKEIEQAKAAAEKAAKDLGEKLGIEPGTVESLRGLWGRVRAVAMAARKMKPFEWKVMLGLVALAIVLGALAVSVKDLLQELLPLSGAAIAGAVAVVVRLAKLYGPLAKELLGKVETFVTLEQEVVETAKSEVLAELETLSNAATEKLASATQREEEETRKIRENEQRLLELKPMQKMKSYVRERRESTDYTKHLGVIAKAHDDFDRLSRHLATVTAKDENGVERPLVDRIVLYIDDLDRCPESKVVDVLQAVHLLLAFPLFVVVVGVDSRWLLHSLKTQMKQFSADAPGDGADALDRTLWESTPINYLEKIFQIPLTLKPMQADGFETLIGDLTKTAEARVTEKKETATASLVAERIIANLEQPIPQITTEAAKEQIRTARKPVETPEPVSRASHLTFTTNEIRYMQALYPLMPSPRGAKRFVNLYRLLRGIIDEYKFQALVNEQNDEHQAVLLLLGMLIGFPEETTDILQELHEKKVQKSAIASPWWTFVSTFVREKIATVKAEASRERWKALGATLERIRKQVKLPDENRPCTHFIEWAEHVARFSFHSGRIVSDYRAGVDAEVGDVQQVPTEPQLSVNP